MKQKWNSVNGRALTGVYCTFTHEFYLHFSYKIFIFRCEISEVTGSKDEFLIHLANDLPILIRHDFLAKSQASYFSEMKIRVNDGEFLICMDFAEN